MKKTKLYSLIILAFFLIFIFRGYFYNLFSLISPTNNSEAINIELEVLKSENYNLKQELKNLDDYQSIKLIIDYEYVISKISIRNPYSFYDNIIVNKGTKDGIKTGMAVLNEDGLIGITKEVYENTSNIELITNPTNEISIIVHGAYGILSGYSKEQGLLIIKNINNYDNIEIGDYVYTSGLGKLPQGILIGKVEEINYDNYQIEQSILVKSKLDMDKIAYVGIITHQKEDES